MIVLFGGGTAPLSIPNSHVDGIDALYIADPHGHNVCGYVAYVNVSGVGWNQSGYSYYNPHLSPPPIYPQHYQFGTDGLMGGEINAEKPDPEHLGTYLALGVDNIKPVSLPQIGSLDFYTYGNWSDVNGCDRSSAATFFATCGPDPTPGVPYRWGSIPVFVEDVVVITHAATAALRL